MWAPPAGPSLPPRFAGPRTQPIGLASTGLPSLAGPISGVGSARPQTPRAPTAGPGRPPGLAGLLALVASHAWPSKPDVITSSPRWLTGGTPLSSPSLAPSSAFRRQSTGAVGGKGGKSDAASAPIRRPCPHNRPRDPVGRVPRWHRLPDRVTHGA